MKLLFPLNFYNGKGGAQESTKLLVGFLESKYKITLLYPDGVCSFINPSNNVKIEHTCECKKWSLSLKSITDFFATVSCLRLNILKYSDENTVIILNDPISAIVVSFFRIKCKKSIYFSRAVIYSNYVKYSMYFFIKNIDLFIGVSDAQCEMLISKLRLNTNKIRKIYNPIENANNTYQVADLMKLKSLNDEIIFSVIGKIDSNKNQICFVKIIKELRRNNIKAIGYIYGECEDNHYLTSLIKLIEELNINEFIFFKSFCYDKYKLYSKTDFVLSTSFHEGFGRTLVEGMSYGKIVAANFAAGGPCSIIDNEVNGILYDISDISSLVSCVKKILQDHNFQQFLKINAVKKSKLYSVEHIAKQIELLF